MKQPIHLLGGQPRFGLALLLCGVIALPVSACTIFVLTDTNRVLFCNNEDGPSGETRIWFVPEGPKHYGAVYVGYDNGWAQGGLNTKGLAFDWVAGYKETWDPDPSLPIVVQNERVLETCATVEEAIAFYREHHESGFTYSKILLADRTGASVIIGAKDGKLEVESQTGAGDSAMVSARSTRCWRALPQPMWPTAPESCAPVYSGVSIRPGISTFST